MVDRKRTPPENEQQQERQLPSGWAWPDEYGKRHVVDPDAPQEEAGEKPPKVYRGVCGKRVHVGAWPNDDSERYCQNCVDRLVWSLGRY